jgi:hypothetical protein
MPPTAALLLLPPPLRALSLPPATKACSCLVSGMSIFSAAAVQAAGDPEATCKSRRAGIVG